MAVTTALEGSRSTKVLVLSVDALIASLNVAVTDVAVLTPVMPLPGATPITVGGSVSDAGMKTTSTQ